MIYNGIDLSTWNSRTHEILRKHDDLPQERFDGWTNLYNGNMKSIELEYLRHIGMKLFGYALDDHCSPSLRREDPELAADLDSQALEHYGEAKIIFELLKELDTSETWGWGVVASQRIENCDVALSYLRRSPV